MTCSKASVKMRKENSLYFLSFCVFWFGEMRGKEKHKIQFRGKNLPMSHTQIFDYITTRKRHLFRSSVRDYTVKNIFKILLTPKCYNRIQETLTLSLSYERWIQSLLSCTHCVKFTVIPSSNEIRSLAKWVFRFTHQKSTCICIFRHTCQLVCPFHPP